MEGHKNTQHRRVLELFEISLVMGKRSLSKYLGSRELDWKLQKNNFLCKIPNTAYFWPWLKARITKASKCDICKSDFGFQTHTNFKKFLNPSRNLGQSRIVREKVQNSRSRLGFYTKFEVEL